MNNELIERLDLWIAEYDRPAYSQIVLLLKDCKKALEAKPVGYVTYDAYRGAMDDKIMYKKRWLGAERIIKNLTQALQAELSPTFMGEPVLNKQPSQKAVEPDAWLHKKTEVLNDTRTD